MRLSFFLNRGEYKIFLDNQYVKPVGGFEILIMESDLVITLPSVSIFEIQDPIELEPSFIGTRDWEYVIILDDSLPAITGASLYRIFCEFGLLKYSAIKFSLSYDICESYVEYKWYHSANYSEHIPALSYRSIYETENDTRIENQYNIIRRSDLSVRIFCKEFRSGLRRHSASQIKHLPQRILQETFEGIYEI